MPISINKQKEEIENLEKKYPYLEGEIKEVFVSLDEYEKICQKLAEKINYDYQGKEVTALILLKGGMMAGNLISKYFNFPVVLDALGATRYKDENKFGENKLKIYSSPKEKYIINRHIIIIDDGQDQGITYDLVYDYISKFKPHSIELCVVVNKPDNFIGKRKAKYIGKSIANDFVVGGGFNDENGEYRNIPAIFIKK